MEREIRDMRERERERERIVRIKPRTEIAITCKYNQ